MQSLRKLVFVLAVLGLVASMASAQTVMNCNFRVENPRTIRPEGITELVGDATLDCPVPVAGVLAPVSVDIRIQYIGTTNVTSRMMPNNMLEAVLLRSSCAGSGASCNPDPAPDAATVVLGANGTQGTLGPGPTTISFQGVKWEPQGAAVGSTFRVRNVRIASPAIGGLVSAFVSIVQTPGSAGSVSPGVTPPVPLQVAAAAGEGLTVDITDDSKPVACNALNSAQASNSSSNTAMSMAFRARFREPVGYNEYMKTHVQEHGVIGWTASALEDAGEANHGTRLRVKVSGVPSGVKVFVSRVATPAQLLLPNLVDASCANIISDPDVTPEYATATNTGGVSGEETVELPVSGGVATACYEIASDTGTIRDDIRPRVYIAYAANTVPAATVITGEATVAPVSTSSTPGGFSRPIPRFVNVGSPKTGVAVVDCRTVLLFPFVASVTGFDTGIAISNTSADSPVDAGIAENAGACTLNFFGNVPVTPKTSSIAAGANATWLLSNAAPGFVGYIYADCTFIGAHGYAFITDLGANKFAQGYLALVVALDKGEKAFNQ